MLKPGGIGIRFGKRIREVTQTFDPIEDNVLFCLDRADGGHSGRDPSVPDGIVRDHSLVKAFFCLSWTTG